MNDKIYWYSFNNDGTDVLENWPYYKEWMSYSRWAEDVEGKALHTLKLAVAQLLADFDDDKNATFDGTDMTKRGQMENLLSMMGGGLAEEEASDKNRVAKRKRNK